MEPVARQTVDWSADEVAYHVYFRTHRGGRGIDHDAARTEFLLVVSDLPLRPVRDWPALARCRLAAPASQRAIVERELQARCPRLGYSEALVRLERLDAQPAGQTARARRRWLTGEQRWGDDVVRFTELWAADEARRLAEASRLPSQRACGNWDWLCAAASPSGAPA